jgi:eukaryotic-like serine/threonine-protein kinase
VFRGEDTVLRRPVALKQVNLLAGHEDHERTRTRARREAQAAAQLNNPSVVDVFDIVEDDGSMWLVMELVDAPSLAEVVRDQGPLDHRRAAEVGLDVLGALDAAHEVGVVHRDVKPANVLVRTDLPAKLADFGVATIRGESRVTSTGLVVGSPAYMSPEQATGTAVGPAADLWALGATLYFAIEGAPPFEGGTPMETASAVVHGDPRPQQHPGPLSRIVEQLLRKDPLDRPTTGEVRTALMAAAKTRPPATAPLAAASEPVTTQVVPAPETRRTEYEPPVQAPELQEPRPLRTESWGRQGWAVGLILLLALGILGWVVVRDSGDDDNAGGDGGQVDSSAQEDTTTEAEATTVPTTAPSSAPATTQAPPPSSAQVAIPAGWTTYSDPNGAYTIAHPPGWEVVPASGPRIDFRDPATGAYLRVDWTDQPKPDPVADWQSQAERFKSRHDGYEEIGIAPYTYRDYTAALWEFRYTSGGGALHVGNLGFVTGNKGYALYFQTPEQDWAASQELFAGFRSAFQPS